ncbi:MAG: phosphopantetheine-binding protein [bacterium]|nr:phosphopantetheine-binding protein [bacterium]
MKKEEFLVELEDVLQREEACNESDLLDEYEEWDSLSKMAVMAFFDKNFGVKITLQKLEEVKTVSDLISLAGDNIDD